MTDDVSHGTVNANGIRLHYVEAGTWPLVLFCHGCPESKKCKFFLDMEDNENLKKLYLDAESCDGYIRDRCVFGDGINIEDSMNLVVDYASGTKMSYSLNAFMSWEGYTISFNGTKGRLEHMCQEKVYINADGTVPGALKKEGTSIKIFPHRKPAYEVDVWTGEGGHGGGDVLLNKDIFMQNPPEDKYKRAADQRAGAWSVLTGAAANLSMKTGQAVKVKDLITGLDIPDFTEMPTSADPLIFDNEDDATKAK